MKLIKRVVTLVMMLALLATPMSGVAQGMVNTFSIGNFEFHIPDCDANIGATLEFVCGEMDGRTLVTINAIGGDDKIAAVHASFDENGIKGTVEGLSNAYSISGEVLEQIMQSAMAESGSEMPEMSGVEIDPESMKKMIESYMKAIESAGDIDAQLEKSQKIEAEFMDYLGDRLQEVGPEDYEVFGNKVSGTRYKFSVDANDLDKFMQIAIGGDENLKAFLEEYFKFLSTVAATEDIPPFTSFSELYKTIGLNMTADIELLTDETRMCERVFLNINVGTETETITMPMVVDALIDDAGVKSSVTMDMQADDVPVSMNMQATEETNGNYSFAMDMTTGSGEEKVDMNMNCDWNSDGTNEKLVFAMKASVAGSTAADVSIGYDGVVSGDEGAKARKGKFSVSGNVVELGEFSFSADIASSEAAMTGSEFAAIDDLPAVSFEQLDEEAMAKLTEEIQVVGINALGVLMQTPGVAEIISMMMSGMAQTDGIDGDYTEDFEGFEDFEDFEDWEEIEGEPETEAEAEIAA